MAPDERGNGSKPLLTDNFDRALTEFPAECDAVMGREWVISAKEALAGCASDARTEMQSRLCLFVLNDALHWFCGKKVGYQRGGNKDPLRMLLRAVRRQLELAGPTVEPAEQGDKPVSSLAGLPHMSLSYLQELDKETLCQRCLDLIAERDEERTAAVESFQQLSSELETAKAQLKAQSKPLPFLSDESLQNMSHTVLCQKCLKLQGERNEARAWLKSARSDSRTTGNRLTQEMSHTIKAVKDFERLSANYVQMGFRLDEIETQRDELLNALGALTQPDGTIRGPLIDGPELDALNAAIVKNNESATDDSFRDGGTMHVPANADVYIYLCDEGKEPAPHGRDELVVAAERLLNVTSERGLALESKLGVAMVSDEHQELFARHALHDAIMHTKTIGPNGPYDPEKAKQEVRVAADQFMVCTNARGIELTGKHGRNALAPDEIAEFNARMALITAYEQEYH